MKRCFTLIEFILSAALVILTISTLTFYYRQLSVVNSAMDTAQNEAFAKRYGEMRAGQVFMQADGNHFFKGENDVPDLFLEGSDNLIFTFDNCTKLNKDFAGDVLGRLFVDKLGRLTLVIWPAKPRWKENENPPFYREILLEKVSKLTFSFFVPLQKGKTAGGDIKKIELDDGIAGKWNRSWESGMPTLPALIKLEINLVGHQEPLLWIFPLPASKFYITFDQ